MELTKEQRESCEIIIGLPIKFTDYKRTLDPFFLKNFNYDNFYRLLYNTELEIYTEFIYYWCIHIFKKQIPEKKEYEESFTTGTNGVKIYFKRDSLNFEIELIETLIALYQNDLKITFSYPKGKSVMANSILISSMTENYLKIFKANDLNKTKLTDYEAIEKIEEIKKDKKIWDELLKYYHSVTGTKQIDEEIDLYLLIDMISPNYYIEREITLEFLEKLLIKHKSMILPNKKGATVKNENIGWIACNFANTIILNKYLKDSSKKITKIPLSNKDCVLIHDILVFFGAIDDKRNQTEVSTKPENFIRTLINQQKGNHRFNGDVLRDIDRYINGED